MRLAVRVHEEQDLVRRGVATLSKKRPEPRMRNGGLGRSFRVLPTPGGESMSGLDDKSIQNLVKKMQKMAKPRNLEAKTYDATAPQRVTDDADQERDRMFKEMKKREF
jgi:hypothetical protein